MACLGKRLIPTSPAKLIWNRHTVFKMAHEYCSEELTTVHCVRTRAKKTMVSVHVMIGDLAAGSCTLHDQASSGANNLKFTREGGSKTGRKISSTLKLLWNYLLSNFTEQKETAPCNWMAGMGQNVDCFGKCC